MIQQRPNMENVWAAQGGKTPPNQEKILDGWIEEIPLNYIANWIENRQDKALLYLMQFGIAEWGANTEYSKNVLTMYKGTCYLSKEASKGAVPDEEDSLAWTVAFDKFGASEAVRLIVDGLITEEGKLPLYVSKANPEMTGPAKGVSFQAASGSPSTLEGTNDKGFSFREKDNTGMFLNQDTLVGLYNSGILNLLIQNGAIPQNSSNKTAVTTEYLKGFLKTNDEEHDVFSEDIENLKKYNKDNAFEFSMKPVGYIKFGFGLIIQWGNNWNSVASTGNLEFPKRFNGQPFYINTSCEHDTVIYDGLMAVTKVRSFNSSSFAYASGVESGNNDVFNPADLKFTWIAVGMAEGA